MKRRWIVAVLSLVLIFSVVGCKKEVTQAEVYTPVEVYEMQTRSIGRSVFYTSKCMPQSYVPVIAKIPGEIVSINVQPGDKVNAGDVLVRLDTSDILSSIEQAQAGLALATASYNQGMEQLQLAQDNLERMEALFEVGAISQVELDQARLAASDSSVQLMEAQIQQAQAGYNQAMESLANMTITAPIAGRVAEVKGDVGAMAADLVAIIVDDSTIKVNIAVAEDVLSDVHPGKPITVIVPALDLAVEAEIANVSPAADMMSGLYSVEINVDNPEGVIKTGMFARVEFDTQTMAEAIAVPSEAIILYEGQEVVYVVNDEGLAEQRNVTLGLDTGDWVELTSGVELGELVVIKGQDYVSDGTTVKIVNETPEESTEGAEAPTDGGNE